MFVILSVHKKGNNMKKIIFSCIVCTVMATAQQMNITPNKVSSAFTVDGKTYSIERHAEPNAYLTNEFSLTSRPSPPFFVQPYKVTDKVETYEELEVIEFLEEGKGVFIDARLPNWFEKGYIPGSINIPFKLFLSDDPQRDKILTNLGAKKGVNNQWDFKNVKTILLYCNGAWCEQSPTAIRALMKIGFPEERMKYFRGGMQSWQLLGLTVIMPEKKDKQ